MTKFSLDNARLAIKGLFTIWVPVLVLTGVISNAVVATGLMTASVGSVDLLFRVWGVGDPPAA